MLPANPHSRNSDAIWRQKERTPESHSVSRHKGVFRILFCSTLQALETWADGSKQPRAPAQRSEHEFRETRTRCWTPLF